MRTQPNPIHESRLLRERAAWLLSPDPIADALWEEYRTGAAANPHLWNFARTAP